MIQKPPDFGESWKLDTAPHCPECKTQLNGVTKAMGEEAGGPTPGSFSICMYCYAVNEFADDGDGGLSLIPGDLSKIDLEERKELQQLRLWLANQPGTGEG